MDKIYECAELCTASLTTQSSHIAPVDNQPLRNLFYKFSPAMLSSHVPYPNVSAWQPSATRHTLEIPAKNS